MSKQTTFDKVELLGIDVDVITNAEAIDHLCAHAAPGQPAGYAVKPYVEFLDRAYRREPLQQLLGNAELVLADGVALVWAAAFLYAGPRTLWRFWLTLGQIVLAPSRLRWPLVDRAAGTTFTWPLLEAAASHGLRVFLVGKETEADIRTVAETIHERLPALKIAGYQHGRDTTSPYGQVSDTWLEHTGQAVTAARADLILVGMGFPLQEKVCAHLAGQLVHGMFIGEGGTFDYESFGGARRKAPAWIQRVGLEWAYRLIQEPRRLSRQLAIPRFIWRIWRSR